LRTFRIVIVIVPIKENISQQNPPSSIHHFSTLTPTTTHNANPDDAAAMIAIHALTRCPQLRNCRSLILSFIVLFALPSISVAFQSISAVPRIPISEFNYLDHYQDKPLIIETGLPVESLCDDLMNEIAGSTITLQQRNKNQQETKLYECTVDQAIDLAMLQSNHNQSIFAFCEGLLDDIRDGTQFTGKQQLALKYDKIDWFDSFPREFRPSDCVILAGEGATSTLHRDPFEWTGTSLCLEGTKLWRFLSPSTSTCSSSDGKNAAQAIDDLVGAYRLPSVAWDDDSGVCLSAGWQSDFSLYSDRDASVPSAKSLSEMEDRARFATLEKIALEWPSLHPNFVTNDCSCWTVIQKPGDLLLIPAHWWHQTYALEPSLAVSSQRCDSTIDAARVIRHILSTTSTLETAPDLLLQSNFSTYTQEKDVTKVVRTLFDHLEGSLSTKPKQKKS
jgi:hypothetical protein